MLSLRPASDTAGRSLGTVLWQARLLVGPFRGWDPWMGGVKTDDFPSDVGAKEYLNNG